MRRPLLQFIGLGLLLVAGIAGGVYWVSQQDTQTHRHNPGVIADPADAASRTPEPSTTPVEPDYPAIEEPTSAPQSQPEESTERQPATTFSATVHGTVLDDSGMPVRGADIMARVVYPVSAVGSQHQAVLGKVAATGEDGTFAANIRLNQRVDRLDVSLHAEALWHIPGDNVQVAGLKQAEHKREVRLDVISAGALSGFVRDDAGMALANVTVTANRRQVEGENPLPAADGSGPDRFARALQRLGRATARTGPNGEYRFDALRTGEYDLTASHGSSSLRSGPGSAIVEAGRETRVETDFVLGAPTTLRFRVLNQDGMSLQAADDGAQASVTVTLYKPDGSSSTARATVEDADFVTLLLHEADAVRFAVSASGYRRSDPVAIRLAPGEQFDAPDVWLTRLPEGDETPPKEEGEE